MNQPPLTIHGYGAVSSAGLDAPALYAAAQGKLPVANSTISHIVGEKTLSYPTHPVDAKALRKEIPKHPRLRRSSPISKFAIVAARQALGENRIAQIQAGEFRLGIVMSLFNGCIGYSNRFYKEVLDDPKLASPILFPETVFNAPASHVASFLGCDGPVYSIIGDTATWFSAIHIAQGWLEMNQVDGCLVIAAEELDWLSSKALGLYSKSLKATEGAAAVYLESSSSESSEPVAQLTLSPASNYTSSNERPEAIQKALNALPELSEQQQQNALLVDSLSGDAKLDLNESDILKPWQGERLSPATSLGYGMGASAGFQTIAALESLKTDYEVAQVLASGTNQHAFAAQLKK